MAVLGIAPHPLPNYAATLPPLSPLAGEGEGLFPSKAEPVYPVAPVICATVSA